MRLLLFILLAGALAPASLACIPKGEHPPKAHKVVWHINFGCGYNNHLCRMTR